MTLKPLCFSLALIAALTSSAMLAQAANIAVVNGKAIPASTAEAFVKQAVSQGNKDTPELRKYVREQLILQEVMLQEAEKNGFSKQDDVKLQLDQARKSILSRALAADYIKKHPVLPSEIQATYNKQKASFFGEEYLARHILVETEDAARSIISQLKGGARFEDLAKKSKDTGSAANGGSLSWAPASNYVKEFSDALKALKKGEMTATPVKTQYGYHVIKLEDTRPAKFPSLEESKQRITDYLQNEKIMAYQKTLYDKAIIQ